MTIADEIRDMANDSVLGNHADIIIFEGTLEQCAQLVEERELERGWQPIKTAPKDGNCLLAINTDNGYTFKVLDRDDRGEWIFEGEPTYCLSYYFEPTHWMPFPPPP